MGGLGQTAMEYLRRGGAEQVYADGGTIVLRHVEAQEAPAEGMMAGVPGGLGGTGARCAS